MARFKLTIEYTGTRYSGWQIQSNARTVQGEIDRAVRTATGARAFELYGAGRTDAGVHALAQVAHLDISVALPLETLRQRLNDELPGDINVLALSAVPRRFHARHDAVARSYLYQIARRRTAFAKSFVWWVHEPLNLSAMRAAASLCTGLQDFQAFSADDPDAKSTTVLVDEIAFGEDGDLLLIRVKGSHFLWKMVRRLVGVMVEVGRQRMAVDAVGSLLTGPSDVPARLTAPASGLFLERIFYKGDARSSPLKAAVPVSFPH